MPLRYLEFDVSEDTDGRCTLDAMASVQAPHWAALLAEVAAVLTWAYREFPSGPGALDDGTDWDVLLQLSDDAGADLPVCFDPGDGLLHAAGPAPGPARHTLTLTLCGGTAFAAAWQDAWGGDKATWDGGMR